MENSIFIGLSRQATLRREMDMVANNIANMNTTGFKGEKMLFVDHIVRSRGGERIMGDKLAYVRDIATVRDMTDGPMERTGNPLDVALHGQGFFTVQTGETEEDIRYTRNGRFRLDQDGQLVTEHGHPVLSDGGQPFFFTPQDTEITIARDGTVSTENGVIGKLGVATFDNVYELREVAGGLYETEQNPQPAEEPDVVQYMVEGSNVEPIIEMSRMIKVNRSYQSVKNFLEKEDERIKNMVKTYAQPA